MDVTILQTYQVSRIMRESHAFASSLTLSRMGSTSLTHSNLPSKLTLKAYLRSAQTPSFVLKSPDFLLTALVTCC